MRYSAVPWMLCLVFLMSQQVFAREEILDTWKTLYPASSSGERRCQLCHAQAAGGEPWNAYGYEIRFNFINIYASSDIVSAIRDTEPNNSDSDPNNLSNLEEINLNLDPGWAPGPVNVHIFKNGDVLRNQLPPFAERDINTWCFPIVASNGAVMVICL